MNNDELRQAIDAIIFIHRLFRYPSNTQEEEITHLLNSALNRMQKIHEEKRGYRHEVNE